MTTRTAIEWTDTTWNPVTGCTKVSAGCDHCYAETIAHRLAGTTAFPNGFAVTLHPDRIPDPLSWRRPRRVFVNSMSDLFHTDVPDQFIAEVFAVMHHTRHHVFQVLTKRAGRMRSLLGSPEFYERVVGEASTYTDGANPAVPWPLPNVWLGVSAETQHWANIRIPLLLDTPAAVRFVSAEPLLGRIEFDQLATREGIVDAFIGNGDHVREYDGTQTSFVNPRPLPAIDWVIVGGESGPGARPMHPDWARAIRDLCGLAMVPFFFKQWGAFVPASQEHDRGVVGLVDDSGHCCAPHEEHLAPPDAVRMRRVGKRRAGRHLDGRTWTQYPQTPAQKGNAA